MHFPIIKFEPVELAPEKWCIDLPYDDTCLQDKTDYYGELYAAEDRKEVISSKWLKNLFDDIAEIDTEKETITFLPPDKIEITLQNYLIFLTSDLYTKARERKLRSYDVRTAAEDYKNCSALFFLHCGQTSFDFIMDSIYLAGETWRIGNIFDAHI